MMYVHLFRCAVLLVLASIVMACSEKPSAAESLQMAAPPVDDESLDTRLKVDQFASQNGALGHYYDKDADCFVFVFPGDVPMPSREQIAAELQTQVRVQHVDMTKAIYDTIESEVAHLHALHRGSTFAIYLDLPTGRAALTSDLPHDVLEPLVRKYPDLIEFKAGSIRRDVANQ